MAVLCFFDVERVPITGRRQLSLEPLVRKKLDVAEDSRMEIAIQQYDGKFFTRDEYPGVRTIEAVWERLVAASGLKDALCEVRVIDDPNQAAVRISRRGLVLITSGYFRQLIKNNDELAAVLGHGLGHHVAGHHHEWLSTLLAGINLVTVIPWPILLLSPAAGLMTYLIYLRRPCWRGARAPTSGN